MQILQNIENISKGFEEKYFVERIGSKKVSFLEVIGIDEEAGNRKV